MAFTWLNLHLVAVWQLVGSSVVEDTAMLQHLGNQQKLMANATGDNGESGFKSYLESLVVNAAKGELAIDDVTRTTLVTMDGVLDEALVNIRADHDTDQSDLNEAAAVANNCNVYKVYHERIIVDASAVGMAASRDAHSQCRTQEQGESGAAAAAWSQVEAEESSFSVAPRAALAAPAGDPNGLQPGSSTGYDAWLRNLIQTATAHLGRLEEKMQTYEGLHIDFVSKDEECTTELREFEAATCAHTESSCSMCKSHHECYSEAHSAYTTISRLAREREDKRKLEFIGMEQMKCLIAVLLSTGETSGRSEALSRCLTEVHDDTHLAIVEPGVDAEVDCVSYHDQSPVTCTADFQDAEYASLFGWSSYKCQRECTRNEYETCPLVVLEHDPWITVFDESAGSGNDAALDNSDIRTLNWPDAPAWTQVGDYTTEMSWLGDSFQFYVPPSHNIFNQAFDDSDAGGQDNFMVNVHSAGVSLADSGIGPDATFCHACAKDGFRWGDTCWALTPTADTNRQCGCNSGGWAGVGIYYGGTKNQQVCASQGGGFAGYKTSGQQKGNLPSVGMVLRVKQGAP